MAYNSKYTGAQVEALLDKVGGVAEGATKVTVDSALSSTSTNPVQNKVVNSALAGKSDSSHNHDGRYYTETEVDTKLAAKVDLTADGVSAAINKLSSGTATPQDNDYYVCQFAGGGTTTTTYHRRPLSSLWTWIKSKLATVATSGSYTDLSNKPTIPDVTGKADIMSFVTNTSATPSVTLALNTVTELTSTAITSISVTLPSAPTTNVGKVQEAVLRFLTPSTAPTVTFPSSIRWAGGSAPTIEASTYYEVSFAYVLGGYNAVIQSFKTA